MPLTDMQCRVAKPKNKLFKLFDGEGLYLQIMPSGSKYWRLKYRYQKSSKVIALGVYPNITLLKAREAKIEIRKQLNEGLDPSLVKIEKQQTQAIQSSNTFEMLAMEWYGNNLAQWDQRYAATILHRLKKYVFPHLGAYPIKLITPTIILACLKRIDENAPDMARRIKQLISQVFKYAIATGKVDHDFTYGLEVALKKYKKGHFASIDIDELPALLEAMHNHKARLYRQTYLAIRLLLLTFVRTTELIKAKWSEFNLETAMWIIPAERMKKDKPHLVPLSKQSLVILNELKNMNNCEIFVFPGIVKSKPTMSNGTVLVALKRMGYNRKMTGHGFRSLALGILKEKLNCSHDVADRQLAHVPKNANDRAYDRSQFLNKRIEIMQRYADYIDKVFIDVLKRQSS
jgi:integrase